MKNNLIFICCTLLLAVSCNSSSDEAKAGSSMFGLGAAAVESLPQVRTAGKYRAAITGGNIEDYNTLAKFFKLECFMPGMDNFCPEGVDTSGGDMNPYKLTSYTLIGSIYHADMYSGGMKTECGGTGTAITSDSFTAAEAGGDPDKFLLDYFTLLTCVNQETWGDMGPAGTVYQAYSVDGNQDYQATLTTRYRIPYNGDADPGQNDVFQVYVGVSGGEPVFLAYNYAGADSMYQRTVLLVNTAAHKFAVKHYEPGTNGSYLTAIGVGGVDRETGELNPGYYYTMFTNDSGTEDSGCVDNTTGDFQADTSLCTAASVPLTWSDSADVAAYLEMTPDDASRLAAFLEKFSDETPLEADDSPSNSTTDPEQNFPYSIEP